MARGPAQSERRRRELVEALAQGGDVSTTQMAGRFGVSAMTIRRDLDALAESGLIVRRYGGAVAAQRITLEFAFDERRRSHMAEKRRIGAQAARRVRAGDTVFLDTGTTTLEVAAALAGRDVPCTVVTSSLVIAGRLWGQRRMELVLVGGRVRRGSPDLVGSGTELMLDKLTADVAFIGSDGLDPERGSFAGDMEAARVAEHMARNARQVVVVADASKLGLAGSVRYMAAEEIGELITDRAAPVEVVDALRRKGVEVTLV